MTTTGASTRGCDLAARLTGVAELHALREALRAGPIEVVASGVSMRPLLRAGDRVRLEARRPRRGDVALVAHDSRLLLHRLVRRRDGAWLLRGDAQPRADGWVRGHAILAVATGVRRDGRAPWRSLDGAPRRWLGLALAEAAPFARRLRRGRGFRGGVRDRSRRGAARAKGAG